jgi:hypothetical protein
VVLTGGIGLLAGTIGSNKILITCLNCGNQFKPGQQPKRKVPKLIWDSETKTYVTNPEFNSIKIRAGIFTFFIIIVFIILCIAASGGFSAKNETTAINSVPKISLPPPNAVPAKTSLYEIITHDTDDMGRYNDLYIYVKDTNAIKKINQKIFTSYTEYDTPGFTIYYFNNKTIAENYRDDVLSENVSDKKLEKMEKHLIGKFWYDGINKEQYLYLGKAARDN